MKKLRARESTFLLKFATLTLIPIILTGLIVSYSLRGIVGERTLADVRQSAELVSRVGLKPRLTATELRDGVRSPSRDLDEVARAPVAGFPVVSLRIVNRTRRIVYSNSEENRLGRREPVSAEFQSALGGQPSSRLASPDGGDRVLEVYTPLNLRGSQLAGITVATIPYDPVAASIGRGTWKLIAILVGGLLALYTMLLALVAAATRRLQQQAAEKAGEALRDSLTGLPNRKVFSDLVEHAIAVGRRQTGLVAVLLMDLNRFKEVNDTLGHFNGDLLLKRIAGRFEGALRETETIARLGGDEFGVLLPAMADRASVGQVAARLLKALEDHFVVGGLALEADASIGIALAPDNGTRFNELIRAADVAMYAAKEAHTGYEFYSASQVKYSPERLALVGELRRAIDEHELVLHYQPKADLRTGAINGVEALVRWKHPTRGFIPPDEFIPLAEHTSLMRPLSLYVLEHALRQLRTWQGEGRQLTIAVNLSMQNLLDLEFPNEVHRLLHQWRVPATSLELEITESVIMAEPKRAVVILKKLSMMGFKLAIDDFGTGYSSLAYLKQLPVSALKIDKSFVMTMTANEDDAVIVRSTTDLGRNLGLEVIAEGVETQQIWDALAGLGCHLAQGYFLTKALPPVELAEWLDAHGGRATPLLGGQDLPRTASA